MNLLTLVRAKAKARDLENGATMYERLSFEDFRKRANDASLTPNEKIGFPEAYRGGREDAIFRDIESKLPALRSNGQTIVDIGSGCGPLAQTIMAACSMRKHRLVLVDSEEMLALLPRDVAVEFRPHRFPRNQAFLDAFCGRVDAVVLYSVIHSEFADGDLWGLFDATCSLLAPGGRALVGDIPNRSMRTRLFNSESGVAYHRAFTGGDTAPPVPAYGPAPSEIDDAVVFGLAMRARAQGFNAYILPQSSDLPFFNRREDLLLERP